MNQGAMTQLKRMRQTVPWTRDGDRDWVVAGRWRLMVKRTNKRRRWHSRLSFNKSAGVLEQKHRIHSR